MHPYHQICKLFQIDVFQSIFDFNIKIIINIGKILCYFLVFRNTLKAPKTIFLYIITVVFLNLLAKLIIFKMGRRNIYLQLINNINRAKHLLNSPKNQL